MWESEAELKCLSLTAVILPLLRVGKRALEFCQCILLMSSLSLCFLTLPARL